MITGITRPNGQAAALGEGPKPTADDKMREAARKFESYFVGFVFEKAYESVPKSDLFSGSHDDMYQSMFIQEVADRMTASPRGLGLADRIYADMKKQTKNSSPDAPTPLNKALGRNSGIEIAQQQLMGLKDEK